MSFQALRITAILRTGIQSDGYLPLDGVLLYQAMRAAYGAQEMTTPGAVHSDNWKRIHLPLATVTVHGEWFYACSFAVWPTHADGQAFWTKRFDQQYAGLIDFTGKRGKVIVEKGKYKGYQMPVFYRHALTVSWYAVGDGDTITRLLRPVTHIGKKTAQGYGRVNGWRVESWPYDWSVLDDRGKLLRAVPEPGGILYGIRPPYWLTKNQIECRLPDL